MPQAQKVNYENCPEGDDILVKLVAVEEKPNDDNAQFKKGEMRWRWVFETLEVFNSDEEPFKVSLFTGPTYIPNNNKCTLTKLLDKICRDLSPQEKEEIDTDTLLNKKFRVDITHVQTTTGRTRANIDNIKRLAPAAKAEPQAAKKAIKPAPVEEDDGNGDPFADE